MDINEIHHEIKTSNSEVPVIRLNVFISVDDEKPSGIIKKKNKYGLSKMEISILKSIKNGDMTIVKLAKKLHKSRITVNHHMQQVRRKLKVNTNMGAVIKALKSNIIEL